MKKYIILSIILTAVFSLSAWTVETASLEEFVYGKNDSLEYDNWLSHVVEGIADPGYNLYAPYDRQTNGFGDFTVPSVYHLNLFSDVAEALTAEEYGTADTLLIESGLPFKLVEFHDTVSGDTYWIIRENINMVYVDDNGTPDWNGDDERGSFDYGWGVYIINPQPAYPVVITAPHITDDFPTVPIAVKAFRELDAYALLMNGTGREVYYNTAPGYYSNSFSLCDPTREEDLPYNQVYQRICDHLRDEFGVREFSLQIHSYDWNRHLWYSSCQISAGYHKYDPGLPIRDYSQYGFDIINNSDVIIHPANSVGIHPDVHLNDYYAVNCSNYEFNYSNEDTTFAVNTSVDLVGYSQNRQMIYSCSGWNDHLTRDPFFHIEMDELPNCYEQSEASYYWFWGYDPVSEKFDYEHIFDKTFEFYSYWVESLAEVVPLMFDFDDGNIPSAVNPLEIESQNYDYVRLSWNKTNCYDYQSYQILYSEEPISAGNYEVWDVDDDYWLGNSAATSTEIDILEENTQYFFQAFVQDANGNYSEASNEVSCFTAPAEIRFEDAIGRDGYINFSFNAAHQTDNAGFLIYRSQDNEDYELIDSYVTNPGLQALNGINNYTYNWSDSTVTNWTDYKYIAACEDSSGNEYWHNYPSSVTPFDIYSLFIEHEDSLLTDIVWFGASPQASNGFDYDYDIDQDEEPSGNYVFAEFYEDWDNHSRMIREIKGGYNFDTNLKSWLLRIRSNQLNDSIYIRPSSNFLRDGRKLYISDRSSGVVAELLNRDYAYENTSGGWRYFDIYWGNITPSVSFNSPANHIYQTGESIAIAWSASNQFLIESYDVYVQTPLEYFRIAQNLPPFLSQIYWDVPANLLLEDACIIIDLLMIDGDRHQFQSDWKFGTVPSNYTLSIPSGRHLVSNPFIGISSIQELLGDDALLYTLEAGEYIPQSVFSYGNGYFLDSPLGNVNIIQPEIQGSNAIFDLQTGWNIIPNPHLTDYNINDIRFIVPDWEMSYSEAVQFGLINRAAYTLNEIWNETDIIREQESFLLYVYEAGLQVKFIPFNENQIALQTQEDEYMVKISASQNEADSDNLILALNNNATNGYDVYYDLPEPPYKQGTNNLRFYTGGDSTYSEQNLNRNSLPAGDINNDIWEWQFQLDMQQLEEISFSLADHNLPPDVFVIMNLDSLRINLTLEGSFTWMPDSTSASGTISIMPEWLPASADIIPPVCSLKAYPNPFYCDNSRSEGIKIAFNIPQDGNTGISVYNIKGQKVALLADDYYPAGQHVLDWNLKNEAGKNIASGIYFTKMSFKNRKQFARMIIIK